MSTQNYWKKKVHNLPIWGFIMATVLVVPPMLWILQGSSWNVLAVYHISSYCCFITFLLELFYMYKQKWSVSPFSECSQNWMAAILFLQHIRFHQSTENMLTLLWFWLPFSWWSMFPCGPFPLTFPYILCDSLMRWYYFWSDNIWHHVNNIFQIIPKVKF